MKKGQVVEYLLQYGWAILIILVVIGALWKMGVFENEMKFGYKEACEVECQKDKLISNGWYRSGGCIVCECVTEKPINCVD